MTKPIYTIEENWLPNNILSNLVENYPIDYIKKWCANPQHAADHEGSQLGNYSAPAGRFDEELYDFIKAKLDDIAIQHLGEFKPYDFFHISFHYDTDGASLEPHNDLIDYRWRVTNQVYLNNNQGVRILDNRLDTITEIPCKENVYYSLLASPWSWHDVPKVKGEKKSIVFRTGKFIYNSIAHPDPDSNTAYVIFNNFHSDEHYAQLGARMGNLTEAWIHKLGAKNIYHTRWLHSYTVQQFVSLALQEHDTVYVIASGYLPDTLDDIHSNNSAVQRMTYHNRVVSIDKFSICKHYCLLTDDTIVKYADVIFKGCRANEFDIRLSNAEAVMRDYYARNLHLNYVDIPGCVFLDQE